VAQGNEFGRASPGLLNPGQFFGNLGHPYGVAATLAAATVHCFVNLPQQVVCSIRPMRITACAVKYHVADSH